MPDAPRRRRAPWIITAIVVVAALVGGAAWWVQLQRPSEPATTATRFWQLLVDGRAQDALALTTTPASSLPNGLLLSDAVYGKADRGIAHVEAHSFTRHGDQASGTVDYTVNGTPHTAQLEMRLRDGGPFTRPSWQITNAPLTRLEVTVASGGQADSLSVDGSSLPLPGGDGKLTIPALPGRYTFALGVSSGLFSPAPQKVTATGATAAVTLGVKPSSKLEQQSLAAATTMLNGCFAQPGLSSDCPLAQGIRNVFNLQAETTVSYQLTRAPQLAFDAQAMQVKSTADGEITTTQSDSINAPFHNVAQVSLLLDVAVTDGKVVLTPDQGGVQNTGEVCIPGDRHAC